MLIACDKKRFVLDATSALCCVLTRSCCHGMHQLLHALCLITFVVLVLRHVQLLTELLKQNEGSHTAALQGIRSE